MAHHSGIFGELLDDFFGSRWFATTEGTPDDMKVTEEYDGHLRSYRYQRTDDGMALTIDLPGVDPATVKVEAERDVLRVTGRNGAKGFKQRYTINHEFDLSTARADMVHGQLKVHIGRFSPSKVLQIPVNRGPTDNE